MGKAAWLVLLLLLPSLGHPSANEPLDNDPPMTAGSTWVLESTDGPWHSSDWQYLLSREIHPLRTLTPHRLLVWTSEGLPSDVVASASPADAGQWKADLGGETINAHRTVRVVLEPNLPAVAKSSVLDRVSSMGTVMDTTGMDRITPWVAVITLQANPATDLNPLLSMPGIAWVEPVLTTHARNGQAAALVEHGQMSAHPFWEVGLDGTGVVLAVADSGLDADHACFRNATDPNAWNANTNATNPALGEPGPDHRKVLHLNLTVDSNDTPGHTDYRHGTHVAGTLVCRDVHSETSGASPRNGSSLANGAMLVFQDIVDASGWNPPRVDELLAEASTHGALVHSDSWGDDTTAYTVRTGRFDAYALAVPWSLALIAPGNGGEGILEPANGRNVIAVSASTKGATPDRWASSAYGPTEADTAGVFLLAPGHNLQSAAADGFLDTNNDNLRSSSGTSMATPVAAGAAGIVQQMYEQGWLHGAREPTRALDVADLAPGWSAAHNNTLLLGHGFTPSGALIRATLAMATSPLDQEARNGGKGGDAWRTQYDGWGVLNLSRLVSPDTARHNASPVANTWVHDSFRLNGSVNEWLEPRLAEGNTVEAVSNLTWQGEGATGPFLQTGDMWQRRFTPADGEDVRLRLAFPAKPEPMLVDDVQLRVRLDDGRWLLGDRWQANGTPTVFGPSTDFNNLSLFPGSNETTVGLNIPAWMLANRSHIDVQVVARYVSPGPDEGSVGLGGDATGFALVIQGVDRDSQDHDDDDLDGVANVDDRCPDETASEDDEDRDGCLDDDDGDGVANLRDECPDENALPADADGDGCLDDSDADGFTDDVDMCSTPDLAWPVNETGCYPADRPPRLDLVDAPASESDVREALVVAWLYADDDGDDAFMTAALRTTDGAATNLSTCTLASNASEVLGRFECHWQIPDDLPPHAHNGGVYDVVLSAQTLNRSPAAELEPLVVVAATNLTLRWDAASPPMAGEEQGGGGQTSVPWLLGGLAVGLAGYLAAQSVTHRRERVQRDVVKPPFSALETNINPKISDGDGSLGEGEP